MEECYNRKDCLPGETIKRIKKILRVNKIKVKESRVINLNNLIFSVRVELRGFNGIGTNGKGITKQYARASAYAELMERIQSRNLIKKDFLSKEFNDVNYIDEKYLSYDKFIEKFKRLDILKERNVRELIKCNSQYRYYTTFYNTSKNKQEDLPIRLINLFSHSNGLCAGNSKEEALVQGICEIFERYAYKKIMLEELSMPTIIVEDGQIKRIKNQLEQIKIMGYNYTIKDCSLSGNIPVVGLLIQDEERQKYLFSIGSDPDFEIALQRCITEIFQGISISEVETKFKLMDNEYESKKDKYKEDFLQLNWLKCYASNNGIHSKNFFVKEKKVLLKYLPFQNIDNNKEALKCVLKVVKRNKLELYIKDYSFLGFNTYKVYIPNISNVDVLDTIKLKVYSKYKDLKENYYSFLTLRGKDNYLFESIFEELSNNIKYSTFIYPNNLFEVNNYIKNDYVGLNYFYLLIIELVLNKKYEKAIRIIERKLDNQELDLFEREYLEYLRLRIVNGKMVYGKKYQKDIVRDVNQLLMKPERYLKKLKISRCPDCKSCTNRRQCKYNKWIKLETKLQNNMKICKKGENLK
ncbi:MAG: YcaO-like family protein [Clostridia bacterium]|nr:YcaO-like family protein [Clostridia bacterium]